MPCPWLPDRCPVSTHHQPLLALRPAEWLASRPGPPPSGWQRLVHPSFPHRRSPHGEVGYHYAAVWTLAAAGLAPAGTVLLWAATLLRGHYPASSLVRAHPPPSRRQPLSRVRRLYGLPCSADFAAGRGGLLQVPDVSSSPCRRSHPAGGAPPHQPACDDPCCLRAKSKRSASGASHFRGYPCDHSRYGPVTRGHPSRWHCRWVSERRFPSALPSKLRGVWLLPRWV